MRRRAFFAVTGGVPVVIGYRGSASAESPAQQPAAATSRMVRVGMGQMLVKTGAAGENLARARSFIERAKQERCDVVVLPECLDLGWMSPEAARLAQPIPGPSSGALAGAARAHAIWVVAGLTEKDGAATRNASVLIDDQGTLRLRHRKVNELPMAWGIYQRGMAVEAADTPFGRVGITICADNSPDATDLALALGRMGARLVLSPCAWAVEPDYDPVKKPYGRDIWDLAYRTLAEKREMATIGVSNVGPTVAGPYRSCIGSSLAIGADGQVLARLPYGADAESFQAVDVPLSA